MYEPQAMSGQVENAKSPYYNPPRAGVGVGNSPDTLERETIPRALDNQLQYLAELHKTISVLEERLMLILAPRPPDPNGASTAPAPSGILQRIQLTSSGIGIAGQRIQTLIERVQL